MIHARALLLVFLGALAAGGAVSCGDDDCSALETRCDGDRAVTCEPTLCTAGPCPSLLVEEPCAPDEVCALDDDDGFLRARCVAPSP